MTVLATPRDIGLAIRRRRKELGWDQSRLALAAGASRQWIIDIEQGKPRAELERVLRTLAALGLTLAIDEHDAG
ncbi:MAG TPA: helix-turn-helix transcriptional regulator, partial [Tahibacter sp.]|nr:helix-turn-helix transcriptional regulator [Tahibacter sp.]